MNNKLTTFLLTIILIALIGGSAVIGMAIYKDMVGDNPNNENEEIRAVNNINTETPVSRTEKDLEKDKNQSITSGSQTVEHTNQQEEESISKYFYQQLTGNSKIIYEKLAENTSNLKQGNYKIEFKDTFSNTLAEEDGSKTLGDDYQTAIEAFMHDNPDLFYIDVNRMYLNIQTTTRLLRTTYNVYISAAEGDTYLSKEFSGREQVSASIEKIEAIKNDIISNLKGNDYEKIMKIHDYLVDNIEYDSTYQGTGTYTIYGALIEKKSVCEGYAKALKYLANEVGIKCEIMQGTATNSKGQTESHAWNCVKIDGIWYEIDATWDDPIIVGSGYKTNVYKYRYFLKGSNFFEKDHILVYNFSENGRNFEYPIISKRDY